MADTLSIEEMNRTRAALGMPLLPVPSSSSSLEFKKPSSTSNDEEEEDDPGSTLESRQAQASANWKKLQDEADEKKRREARRAALKKERETAQRFVKLEGKGLGEAQDGEQEVDTKAWLLGTNKRQKKIAKERARMLQRELEEREKQVEYTEKDLAGQKVGHELGDFDEGEQILTLKDAAVDAEDEDDELENIDLREKERTKERLKLKMKKPVYDPNAEDEDGEGTILGQYDEEIDGKKKKNFTLNGQGRTEEEFKNPADTGANGRQGMKFSLDFLQDDKPVSDYMDISEVKIKKPRKKKKDKFHRRHVDDDEDMFPIEDAAVSQVDVPEAMDTETGQPNGGAKRRLEDTSFVDDDDLQSSLAKQRRAALKKRKLARPEDIARQLREEASATPDAHAMDTDIKNEEDEEESGLVIDEMSEFVANLQKPQAPERRRASSAQPSNGVKRGQTPESPQDNHDGDVEMAQQNFIKEESSDGSEGEQAMSEASRIKRETSTPIHEEAHTATGLADEETLNNAGIGSILGMLTQRGIVKPAHGSDLNVTHSRQADFLRHKERLEKEWERKAQDKRRRDRDAGLFDRISKRQQEEYAQQENKQRDQYVSRQLDELFNKEYRPNVELKYVDEHGRHMDQREAFKQMSHQFHGKGSGKLKTEKRLKKIDDEKKRDAMSTLDSSQRRGMDNAAGTMGRNKGQAGVRLQ